MKSDTQTVTLGSTASGSLILGVVSEVTAYAKHVFCTAACVYLMCWVCALLFTSSADASPVPAYTISSGSAISCDRQLSLGFAFTANSAVTIDALGYYDDQGDSFAMPRKSP